METIYTAAQLVNLCRRAAAQKTLYVRGAFGWPLTQQNKTRAAGAYAYNRRADRAAKLAQADGSTFGFDCVCFVKALLWGWKGDQSHYYGGAAYNSGGVPDIGEGALLQRCSGISTDFGSIEPGELLWMPGHCGIYLGDGLAAEASPAWADGVQLTACNCDKAGYHRRNWQKHGRLPWIAYPQPLLPLLRQGSKGASVRALQLLLTGNGHSCGPWGADGDFGSATATALKAYQHAQSLEQDGICNPRTWAALLGL